MQEDVEAALKRIVRGTGVTFIGTVISMFFGFLSKAIIARYFSTTEYGVFNLALTVLNIALVMATLGFQNALPREIAFYGEKEPSRIEGLISTALAIVALNSIILMIILIIGAKDISQIFHEVRLIFALRIAAFSLPFSALTGTIISISQGFGRVKEKVYFQNIFYQIIWLLLILFIWFLECPFICIFFTYLIAQLLTFLILIFEINKTNLFKVKPNFDLKLGKKLIIFSLPLLLTGILGFIMTRTDTLMLGYYTSLEDVGIYSAAVPLAQLGVLFLNSAAFLYFPVASRLYAMGKVQELKRIYQILTKWIFLLTFPLFSMMVLFPDIILKFFFGTKYIPADLALQILSLGVMVQVLLGLNGTNLIVIGESNFVLISNLLSAVLNILLNVILIPLYGIEGAAVATAVSYAVGYVLISFKLYQKSNIHPFSRNYLKILVISSTLLGLIWSFNFKVTSIWYSILDLVGLLVLLLLLILLSKSVDDEDIEMLLIVKTKLSKNLKIQDT